MERRTNILEDVGGGGNVLGLGRERETGSSFFKFFLGGWQGGEGIPSVGDCLIDLTAKVSSC